MALRLPTGEREKLLAKYKTKLFEAYGIVQKRYVTVPDALLAKTDELKPGRAQPFPTRRSTGICSASCTPPVPWRSGFLRENERSFWRSTRQSFSRHTGSSKGVCDRPRRSLGED